MKALLFKVICLVFCPVKVSTYKLNLKHRSHLRLSRHIFGYYLYSGK